MVTYARLGGPDGLRMTRCAFAVIIKYNQAVSTLETMVDEVDIMEGDGTLEGLSGVPMAKRMNEVLKENEMEEELKQLVSLWSNACKMRLWLMEKKKNLAGKVERSEKEKFVAKIRKQMKKDKLAEDADAENKSTPEEEKKSDTPTSTQIDTS